MNAVQIQAWKPKRAKRRVALPIVVLVNSALVATGLASSAIIYQRLLTSPPVQIASTLPPATESPTTAPPIVTSLPIPRVTPVNIEPSPESESIDISKPQRAEPRPIAPLLEAKPPEAIAATVIVDVSEGRQVVELPGEGTSLRITRIEGFPGRPIVSPSDGDLSQNVDIQPLGDRSVYLELSTRGDRLMIETKSALPQFKGRLSADRVAEVRDEATKRFELASKQKAAILTEISVIDAFLKDGQPKKLTVYNQGETRKAILRTNLEVIEIELSNAKEQMTQAKRVYSAVTSHIPLMRLVIVQNIPAE
jgi:hypothetical protein